MENEKKYINLVLCIDAHAEYDGKVSGRHYIWHKAGDTQLVQEEDASELLQKRLGTKLCCGSGDNHIFEINKGG